MDCVGIHDIYNVNGNYAGSSITISNGNLHFFSFYLSLLQIAMYHRYRTRNY